jgi:hypothetical protein
MLALVEHRHHVGVVGGMGVAAVGIVVEIGVTAADVVAVVLAHIGRLDVAAEDVHRQAFGRGEQLVVARHEAAGEIAGGGDHGGPRGAQQCVGHLAHDAVEAVRHHGHEHGIEVGFDLGGRS